MNEKLKPGDTWFNGYLSEHAGHRVEIATYRDAFTGIITDYQLKCLEDDCDEPVGIAVEFASHALNAGDALAMGLELDGYNKAKGN